MMYKGLFLVLTSVALVLSEDASSGEDTSSSKILELLKEMESKLVASPVTTTEKPTTIDPVVYREIVQEISNWINGVNCIKSDMNFLKCMMMKKAYDKFSKNPKQDINLMKKRVKFMWDALKEDGYTDKKLEEMTANYGYILK